MKRLTIVGGAVILMGASCTHYFVQPTPVALSTAAPAVPPSALAVNTPQAFDGYLRMYVSADLSGISRSWTDKDARTKFKKVLVSIQFHGIGDTEVPIAEFDVSNDSPAVTKSQDIDIGRLAYYQLDGTKNSGTTDLPSFDINIRAIPETLASTVSDLVQFTQKTLNALPPGLNIASLGNPAVSALVNGVLGGIEQQAGTYANRKWTTTAKGSLRMVLDKPVSAWVLVPESDSQQFAVPTDLVACNKDGKEEGILVGLCRKNSKGVIESYSDWAYLLVSVAPQALPSSDVFPKAVCNMVKSPAGVEAYIASVQRYKLSQSHAAELEHLNGMLRSASAVMSSDGAGRAAAYATWAGYSDEVYPDANNKTPRGAGWLAERAVLDALGQCLADFEKTDAVLPLQRVTGAKVYATSRDISKNGTLDADKVYEAVDAMRLALASPGTSGDASPLLRDVAIFERTLYAIAFDGAKEPAGLKASLAKYPRCEYCQGEGVKKLQSMPSPPALTADKLTAAPGVENLLADLKIDVQPLVEVRSVSAELAAASQKPKGPPAELIQKREDAIKKAQESLFSVGIPVGAQFLRVAPRIGGRF